jgi:hypothetical protein
MRLSRLTAWTPAADAVRSGMANSQSGREWLREIARRAMRQRGFELLPPESGLRQWVLTFPFSWRRRLAQDAGLRP